MEQGEGGLSFLDNIFGQPSARVVALARLGLAAVFLLGTWVEPQPNAAPIVMPALVAFLTFSVIVAAVTWNNWWLDARISLLTHAVDVCFFVVVVGSPEGYSSPYFLFFAFLLLSSAIRWTWRETAATAAVVVALYVVAGLLLSATSQTPFETRRFIIRTGYLLILSAVLIWFGVRRRFAAGVLLGASDPPQVQSGESPLAAALRRAMYVSGAGHGTATWRDTDGREEALVMDGPQIRRSNIAMLPEDRRLAKVFLFDAGCDRALYHTNSWAPQFTSVSALTGEAVRGSLGGAQGIGIPIEGRLGRGLITLSGVKQLHTDHLALGDRLHAEIPSLMERRLLFSALRDGAIARERLALARNLHDGVVQFLAGSAYKIEAISRSHESSKAISDDLQDLKQLMLLEQEDLRASIGTLRKENVGLDETAAEAEALCKRLARQWRINCSCKSEIAERRISTRLHMDVLNMIKEGVANAARHGGANEVDIRLSALAGELELIVENDAGVAALRPPAAPWSIRERTAENGGSVAIAARGNLTVLRITVPFLEDRQ